MRASSVCLLVLFAVACHSASGRSAPGALKIEVLLRHDLAEEIAPGREVILSYVEIPPHTTLPVHWHPGEEFLYLIDGEVTLMMGEERKTFSRKGDVGVVPLKAVHSASTGTQGARLVVFRVHIKGEPSRVLVDESTRTLEPGG